MQSFEVPLNDEVASIVTGSLLWAHILLRGTYPDAVHAVNTELCLDVLARCEEHGLEPDPEQVTLYVAGLVAEQNPGQAMTDNLSRAAELIADLADSRGF